MAKYRAHIVLIALTLSYISARYARFLNVEMPSFFFNYFTDLLFVPIVGLLTLLIIRFFKNDNKLQIPIYAIILQTILFALYFEWFLPNYSANHNWYTADLIDVGMYAIGGGGFWMLQRWV